MELAVASFLGTLVTEHRAEIRARLRWVGGRWALRAFGRLIALYVTSPPARRAMMDQLRGTRNFSPALGYGLFAGRK